MGSFKLDMNVDERDFVRGVSNAGDALETAAGAGWPSRGHGDRAADHGGDQDGSGVDIDHHRPGQRRL